MKVLAYILTAAAVLIGADVFVKSVDPSSAAAAPAEQEEQLVSLHGGNGMPPPPPD